MNMLFERFLGRYLRETAPDDVQVTSLEVRSDVFSYFENTAGWNQPTIRPDFVFRRRRTVIAIGDAKYKNRHAHPPTSTELYQLTTYGMAYSMPEPRDVLLLHPVSPGDARNSVTLLFTPPAIAPHVRIRVVGVPVDGLLNGTVKRWWPLDVTGTLGDLATGGMVVA